MNQPLTTTVATDNTPGGAVCPPWLFLLDDPTPERVAVIGPDDQDVVQWFLQRGAQVETSARPDRMPRGRADLVVLTGSERSERPALMDDLESVAARCRPSGAMAFPGAPDAGLRTRLSALGFLGIRGLPAAQTRAWARGRADSVSTVVLRDESDLQGSAGDAPRWLRDLTGGTPWSPKPGGWNLRVPDAYPSQKAIVRLGTDGARPDAVAKITRHPRFNDRLVNEAVQLRRIAQEGSPLAARVPAVFTSGLVAGLAVVVEQGLEGRPFLDASRLGARCPMAGDAVRAITALQRSGTTSGADLAERLDALLGCFVESVEPDPDVARFLTGQIEQIAEAQLPDVWFHGDLGTWNLLVHDGSVRILDWESAEVGGPPLWDLAYFVRSYAVRSGRRRGLKRRRAIDRHLLGRSPLHAAATEWFHAYAQRIGLERHLVEPLFHTCWMHRAVKERTRLGPGQPGHYGPLAAHLVRRRDAPGLQGLLGR